MEGVEVPVIAIQVNSSPDQPATASIQIVPTDTALNLLPRTYVAAFYLDDDPTISSSASPRTGQGGSAEDNSNRFEAADEKYKLLFTGELIGYSYGKDPGTRQMVLQCMDLSSYWDTAYQWFADYSVGGNGFSDQTHNFTGSGDSTFDSISGGHQWVLGEAITTKPQSLAYRDAKGLLGGIIHVMEAITGIRYVDGRTPGFNGVNDFFTIAELRYNLMGMLGAVEKDDSSARMYASKAFMSWLRNGMTSLGSMMSFRDIINHICQLIFHNIYPNTCPYYVPSLSKSISIVLKGFFEDPSGMLAGETIRQALGSLCRSYALLSNIKGYDDFASGMLKLEEALNGLSKAIEESKKVKTNDTRRVVNALEEANSSAKEGYEQAKQNGWDKAATSNTTQPINAEGQVAPNIELSATKLSDLAKKVNESTQDAIDIINTQILGLIAKSKRSIRKVEKTSTAHLYTQLLLPETFWVAPPRCNVIFPDQYYQFSYSRNLMREVSRLCLTSGPGWIVGDTRGSNFFNSCYYAPNIKNVRGKLFGSTMSRGAKVLLAHEIHCGIIPKFEWVTDAHRWAAKAFKEGGTEDGTGKVKYLQRLANFNFYLHRWSARSMSIGGIFNPNLVNGLPSVVINTSMPSGEVVKKVEETLRISGWRPTQFVGKIVNLTHSISQQGASTTANMAYCRTHRGIDDEFLGALLREESRTKAGPSEYTIDVVKIMSTSPGGSMEDEVSLGTGPTLRRVTIGNERILVLSYLSGNLTKGTKVKNVPQFNGLKVIDIVESKEDFTKSHSEIYANGITENDWSAWQMEGTAKGEVATLPQKITFTFDAPASFNEKIVYDLAIEDALMPGWYSDVWKNKNITRDVYRPLLHSEAITDTITFPSSESAATLLSDMDANLDSGLSETEKKKKKAATQSPKTENELSVVTGSVEEAIDSITVLYSLIKNKGLNIHEFIREYTTRPIASMVDVVGSANVEFDDNGNVVAGSVEGFHSRAFGDYNADVQLPGRKGDEARAGKDALKALFPGVNVAQISSLKRKAILNQAGVDTFAISPEMDPRGKARQRVRAYVAELSVSRGLLG
jgi:hypothetical protein